MATDNTKISSSNVGLLDDEEIWKLALKHIPRGVQTMSKAPDQFVDGAYPKFAESASGAHFYDRQGNRYLDFMCGLGPVILGYNNRAVNAAIEAQLKKGIIFSIPSIIETKLAMLISEIVPCAEMVRFAKNGSDVCLAATRIAMSHTGREHIATCGFHGWNDWYASVIRDYGIPRLFKDIIHDFPFNDLVALEKILETHECAAVVIEPQALTAPMPGFLAEARRLAHKHGAILVFDEVVTGFRWALGGAQEKFDVIPDIACIGKSMANGMPISAIVGRTDLIKELEHCFFSMTFGGECLSIAAAIATIEELKVRNYAHIWKIGDEFRRVLEERAEKNGLLIDLQGSAPRHHLEFSDMYPDKSGMRDLFFQEMVKNGVFFSNVLYKQFSHTIEDIEDLARAADRAFAVVSKHQNDVDTVLEGKRSIATFIRKGKQ